MAQVVEEMGYKGSANFVKARIGLPYKTIKGFRFLQYQPKGGGKWINAYAKSTGKLRGGNWSKTVKNAKGTAARKIAGKTILGITVALEIIDYANGGQTGLEMSTDISMNFGLAIPGVNVWAGIYMAADAYYSSLSLDEQMRMNYEGHRNAKGKAAAIKANDGYPITFCFIEGTKVLTNTGLNKIENIKVGDSVYTYNLKINKLELSKVNKNFSRESNKIYNLKFKNELIQVTEEHPFYVTNKSAWIATKNLFSSDLLLNSKGDTLMIDSIFISKGKFKVYNLGAQNNHNYFVSSLKVLVHNKDCFVAGSKILMSDNLEKAVENIKVGDKIKTYNFENKKFEIGIVKNLVAPVHHNFIKIKLSNGDSIECRYFVMLK